MAACLRPAGVAAGLALVALFAVGPALASPTSNEWKQCHREAAALLQFCLDERPGGRHDERCWRRSRQQQQACYEAVVESHRRPQRRPHPAAARGGS